MIDRQYIKQLAKSMCFDVSDEQADKIVTEIKELNDSLQHILKTDATPVNYARAVNYASLRHDVADKQLEKDYLSNAKKADKYVVGK